MDPVEEEEKLPELYSKSSIMIITLITLTAFGAILYSINLYRVNQRRFIFPTMLGAVLYQILGARFSGGLSLRNEIWSNMVLNFIGGMLILGLWDMQIGRNTRYRPRNTLSVFLIILILLLIQVGLTYIGVTNLPE